MDALSTAIDIIETILGFCLIFVAPFVATLIYEFKLGYKRAYLSFLPIIIIIPALIYGSLRRSGKLIYVTDAPADILPKLPTEIIPTR